MGAERIRVIPNGIDLDWFSPAPDERAERPTLLFLGRLREYKRVDLIVSAVGRLASRGVDVELLVVGEGDRRASLERQVRELRLQDRVKLLGFVDEGTKRHFRVSSDAPGLRESVLDGETGLLVPHGEVAALAAALEGLIRDRATRERLGRQARAFAGRFSWEAAADGVEEVLREVVTGRRPD
jgi:glycosyltransferase involved in cell wall biosynthesis